MREKNKKRIEEDASIRVTQATDTKRHPIKEVDFTLSQPPRVGVPHGCGASEAPLSMAPWSSLHPGGTWRTEGERHGYIPSLVWQGPSSPRLLCPQCGLASHKRMGTLPPSALARVLGA